MQTKIKYIIQSLLLLVIQFAFGQTEQSIEIQGQITVDSIAVQGVSVFNSTSKKATLTSFDGSFIITVKLGDVLLFTALNLETAQRIIDAKVLKSGNLIFNMISKSILLKEVKVNKSNVSAESLGIIPYGQKKYTPAERKLYTATSGGGIDGLLNTISGRKTMLKKEIIIEKKQQLLAKIDVLFDNNYYIETLNIPVLYIKGFQYYCIEDVDMANALLAKNKVMVLFLIAKLAEKYNKIVALESK